MKYIKLFEAFTNKGPFTLGSLETAIEKITDEQFVLDLTDDLDYDIDHDSSDDGRGDDMTTVWLSIKNPTPEALKIVNGNGPEYKELLAKIKKWAEDNNLYPENVDLTTAGNTEADQVIMIGLTDYYLDEE